MMLRRTNAPQVVPIYNEFIQSYPDPFSLADAPFDDVLTILRPLGLSWRAANIHRMAEVLVERCDGEVPSTYDELVKLPGVGDYVASAVCCFAFGKSLPIVDTNTVRVVGRYFGFETHAESRRRRSVREAVIAVTRRRSIRQYNYSFLDFAAIICKASQPQCNNCPVQQYCIFGQG